MASLVLNLLLRENTSTASPRELIIMVSGLGASTAGSYSSRRNHSVFIPDATCLVHGVRKALDLLDAEYFANKYVEILAGRRSLTMRHGLLSINASHARETTHDRKPEGDAIQRS